MSRARYGFDAPPVILGLFAGGLVFAAVAMAARFWMYPLLGAALMTVALVPLAFGGSMLWYGARGKYAICDAMLDALPWRGDERVLDVGVGRGLLAIEAAKRSPRGQVVGIDIWRPGDLSYNTRESALANAELEGVSARVAMVHASATAVPYAAGSFDVVVSLFCLHNIEPRAEHDRACHEIARVLRAGGVAVIGDYTAIDDHARAFTAAGLIVERRWNKCRLARALCWSLVLRKPVGGAFTDLTE